MFGGCCQVIGKHHLCSLLNIFALFQLFFLCFTRDIFSLQTEAFFFNAKSELRFEFLILFLPFSLTPLDLPESQWPRLLLHKKLVVLSSLRSQIDTLSVCLLWLLPSSDVKIISFFPGFSLYGQSFSPFWIPSPYISLGINILAENYWHFSLSIFNRTFP